MDKVSRKAVEVGGRIVEARREAVLTQAQLAKELGVSERSIQAYETGDVIPYRHIRDLARVLGQPADWLLHGETIQPDPDAVMTEIRALRTEVRDLTDTVRDLADAVAAGSGRLAR